VFLVFLSPLLIPSKLLQVSQIFKDACRLDGEYLLLFSWVECGFILYDQSIICPYHHDGWRQGGHC
jgi:hypothetical protein